MIRFFLIVDVPAGSAWTERVDLRDVWTPSNPSGWRYAQFGGDVVSTHWTRAEAEAARDAWLSRLEGAL